MNSPSTISVQLVDRVTVAKLLMVSPATLCRWAKLGRGPRPVRIGPRRVGYRVGDVEQYIASLQETEPLSAEGHLDRSSPKQQETA